MLRVVALVVPEEGLETARGRCTSVERHRRDGALAAVAGPECLTSRVAKPSRPVFRWSRRRPVPMLMDVKPAGLRQTHQDSRGRTWSVVVVPAAQAGDEDAEFWRTLTPEQRVVAVHGCLESALKAQGKTRVSRLRRVARVVKR